MTAFLRIFSILAIGVWASVAGGSNVEERLRALIISHEAETDATSDLAMRRLVRGYEPTQGEGIYSKAFLASVPSKEGGKEWRCMAEALYFEARGENVMGQFAVAEVILNRVDHRKFPNTICGVVLQGSGNGKHRCQFSYACDGKLETIHEKKAWENVGKVARLAIEMDKRPLTHNATFYHTNYVSPSWSKKFPRTATIGVHHFYKEPDQISSR
ncbi:MAG: cell wall hydrolase [Paracoccaceae bacterium]|jgi:spore germination cell wall hydrolase CwlJ-like protein|nr:cell wall hydrolase [Paracoccaceae bacterium]